MIEGLPLRIGRRGAFLLAWGILFALYGLGLWAQPLPQSPDHALLLHEHIPEHLRAACWVITGLVAVAHAFRRKPGDDALGFIALILMPTIRMASYAYAFAVSIAFPGEKGDPRGWVVAVFYAVFVASVIIVAGWREDHANKGRP